MAKRSVTIASMAIVSLLAFFLLFRDNCTPKLLLNMENTDTLPHSFRMMSDHITPKPQQHLPSLLGLNTLLASASHQFSEKSLKKILKTIPSKNVVLLDLRQESHGFINGIAVGWYGRHDWGNVGKKLEEIEADEAAKLTEIKSNGEAEIFVDKSFHKTKTVKVESVATEEELAKQFGVEYVRIPVTDHERPTDNDVEAFLAYVRLLPVNTWIHFHCVGGHGRSTTFLAMYDMMHNARDVGFDDIILRQQLLGGADLTENDKSSWKSRLQQERLDFLKVFYRYCQETPGTSWTAFAGELLHK